MKNFYFCNFIDFFIINRMSTGKAILTLVGLTILIVAGVYQVNDQKTI